MRLKTSWRDGLDKPAIYLQYLPRLEILWRDMRRLVQVPKVQGCF